MKRKPHIGITVLLSLVLIYLLQIISVWDVIYNAKRALDGRVGAIEDIGALTRYLPSSYPHNEPMTKSTLIPLIALHSFHNGQIKVLYWQKTIDKTTGETLQGSSGIPSTWKITKVSGRWKAVEIVEDP